MCFLFQIWQIFEINKKIGQHYRGRPIIGADIKHFYILSISAIFKTDLPIIFFFFWLCKQTYYLQVTLFIGE